MRRHADAFYFYPITVVANSNLVMRKVSEIASDHLVETFAGHTFNLRLGRLHVLIIWIMIII